MTYQSPLRDMRFILEHVVDLPSISRLPGMEEFSDELAWASAGYLERHSRSGKRKSRYHKAQPTVSSPK